MPTFFINGTSLSNSTAVFLDSEQLICAPDGYYSDGAIVREQAGCSLLPQTVCPSCAGDCPVNANNIGLGVQSVYYTPVNIGNGTGAVVIKFSTTIEADGIIAELDGSYYNELSSPYFGYLAAPPNLPTFTGRTFPPSSGGSCPDWSIGFGPSTLNKREWNGSSFASIPGTETVTVIPAQAPPQTGNSGNCVMVVPKTLPIPQTINVSVYVVCTSSVFNLEIGCPAPLPTFQASIKFDSPSDPGFCGASATANTFYMAKVQTVTPCTAPLLDVTDWVFQDENGENKLEDGYYLTYYACGANDTIHVINGVIVELSVTPCP